MEVAFNSKALNDITFWKETNNIKIQEKISKLIINILQSPYTGLRKPEPLKHELSGF